MDRDGFGLFLPIFICLLVIITAYYLMNNDDAVLRENYDLSEIDNKYSSKTSIPSKVSDNAASPPILDNRKYDDISNSIVDDLVAQYTVEDRPMEGGIGSFIGSDPMAIRYGEFTDYGKKLQLNMKKTERPYSDEDHDPRDFSYNKKEFTTRTPSDVKELFDVNKMLPQEVVEDWFDVEPLLTTKKIKGTHLIHPKVHMGVNTVSSSLRNGTHDLRGDIANPKINVSPWNNSTIEPDTNLKGICNPI